MSTPYERDFRFTTVGVDEIVELKFPGRCEITKLNIVREDGGAIDFDLFSRKFTSAARPIINIVNQFGGPFDGNTVLRFAAEFGVVRVGDEIVVAGSTVAAYNTRHRVEKISDDKKEVVTDQSFTVEGLGGTATLDIASADRELYRVLPNIAGGSPILEVPTTTGDVALFVNRDPRPNANIGVNRVLYVLVAAIATYRLNIAALLNVAGEG